MNACTQIKSPEKAIPKVSSGSTLGGRSSSRIDQRPENTHNDLKLIINKYSLVKYCQQNIADYHDIE
jgi:hypothetical protein